MPGRSKFGEPNVFWKYGSTFYNDPWIEAIAHIDAGGGSDPLIEMLRSDVPLDDRIRRQLADMLTRWNYDGDNADQIAALSETGYEGAKRNALADTLSSKKLKRNVGNPAVPSYAESWSEAVMSGAMTAVDRLMAQGKPKKRAIAQIATEMKIDEGMLGRAMRNATGSFRRAAKRRGIKGALRT